MIIIGRNWYRYRGAWGGGRSLTLGVAYRMGSKKDFARQRPSSWSVWIAGVGDEYEWPKHCLEQVECQLWLASFNIPFGLGNAMMREYIAVAFGFVGGNWREHWDVCQRGSGGGWGRDGQRG